MGWFDWLFRPPTEAKFAQLFMAELQKAGETRAIRFDADEFQLVISEAVGDGNSVINLRNFYSEFCSLSPADRKRYLPETILAVLAPSEELPTDFAEIKPHLRPKIWARAGIEHTNLQARIRGGHKLDMQQEVGSHLLASIVYDMPRSVRSVSPEELEEWGTSYYEALEIATQNLTEAGFEYAKLGEGLYISATGDSYDASRILLVEFIRSLDVQGDIIAMVPNRDLLLVGGADDDHALEAMLALAEQAVERPRPLASTPLRLVGNDWVDWMPSRGHPLFDRFKALEVRYLLQEYAQQKEMLDKLYEQQGIDRFVASFVAASDKEGENMFSYGVWSEGVETLLPQTERVMFFRPTETEDQRIVAAAPWHKVEKIVGHLMSDVDLYPRRYLVTEFPNEEELRLLGKEGPM